MCIDSNKNKEPQLVSLKWDFPREQDPITGVHWAADCAMEQFNMLGIIDYNHLSQLECIATSIPSWDRDKLYNYNLLLSFEVVSSSHLN